MFVFAWAGKRPEMGFIRRDIASRRVHARGGKRAQFYRAEAFQHRLLDMLESNSRRFICPRKVSLTVPEISPDPALQRTPERAERLHHAVAPGKDRSIQHGHVLDADLT